jgi:hypothetical protein
MLIVIFIPFLLINGPVSGEIQIAQGYDHGQPFVLQVIEIPLKDVEGNPVLLEAQAAFAFSRLMRDAKDDGFELRINYGFRTHEQQSYWYSRYEWLCENKDVKYCNMAAPPGWSDHQKGLSLDIGGLTTVFSERRIVRSKYLTKNVKIWTDKGGCWVIENQSYRCYTSLYYWFLTNARFYGFKKDVPGEYWHWTYEPSRQLLVEVGG